jgi:hypothetical protein
MAQWVRPQMRERREGEDSEEETSETRVLSIGESKARCEVRGDYSTYVLGQ